MKKVFIAGMFVTILALFLASCSSKGSTKLDITLDDFDYAPMKVSIPAGEEISITVTNKGNEEHEWVLFNYGKDAGDAFGDEDEGNIYWEIEAAPGESKTETFTAPSQPGEYYITCGIKDHLQEGMVGKAIVVE